MEPSEAQYLIINALDTLDLLGNFYDEDPTGNWYIRTPSPVLLKSIIQQNCNIIALDWQLEL